jgi:hypothetical protein
MRSYTSTVLSSDFPLERFSSSHHKQHNGGAKKDPWKDPPVRHALADQFGSTNER